MIVTEGILQSYQEPQSWSGHSISHGQAETSTQHKVPLCVLMLSTQHPQLRIHKNNIRIHCVLEISFNINTYDENRHIQEYVLFVFLPLPSEGRATMSQDFCPIGRRENYEGGLEGDKTLGLFSLERTVNISKESPLNLKN